MEISTIVVGTDGSGTAHRALAVAADLARLTGARLHVVHGYVDPSVPYGLSAPPGPAPGEGSVRAGASELPTRSVAGPVANRWRESSESLLAEALGDPTLEHVAAEGHSVVGTPVDAIVGVAERVGADLVVVGNRGMRSAGSALDSVPDGVAHRAPCHVLIAKTT